MHRLPLILLAGALFGVLAYAGILLTREHSRIAALWLPNAVLAAWLLRKKDGGDNGYVGAAFIGNVIANLAGADNIGAAAGMSVCNLLEVMIVVRLMRRLCGERPDMMDLRHLMTFAFIGGGLAPVISGLGAAAVLSQPHLTFDIRLWISWIAANGLGMLIVAPITMIFIDAWRDRNATPARSIADWILTMGCGLAVAAVPFASANFPTFFLAGPFVILAAFRLGALGTAVAVLMVSLSAMITSALGYGMISLIETDLFNKMLILQAFMVAIFGMSLPVAAALAGRDRLRNELERARRAAESANHAKSTFLANMSHEIRTPMMGVIGFTDLLLASDLDDNQRRQVRLIADSGGAMMRLLSDILDISKVEAGEMRIAEEAVDITQTLDACVKLLTPDAEQRGILLRLQLDPDLPPALVTDGLRISQIVLNLIGNALKFTERGSVTVRAKIIGEELEIAVIDTGIGINIADQQLIFEEFTQLGQAAGGSQSGVGLGLAISNRLARLMGGELSLTSEEGRGSSFFFRLPARPAEQTGERFAPPEQPGAHTRASRPLRILIAEDNPINQTLLQSMIGALGHEAVLAADGHEAVARATDPAERFDLVLMDVRMPHMNGRHACRMIRQTLPEGQLPVIAMTANAYEADVRDCLAAGMQEHLIKPLQMRTLADVIARWTNMEGTNAPEAPAAPDCSLQQKYEARKSETLQRLDALIRSGSLTGSDVEAMASIAHQLAGVAALFGEPELGDHACLLVNTLESLPSSGEAGTLDALIALQHKMTG